MSEALLLVDNSNTRTKFSLVAPGHNAPGEVRTCPTAEINASTLKHTLAGWEYAHAVLCSVAPHAARILCKELGCPVSEISAASCPHLLRGYAGANTLGADRIANAAAVATLYPLPCIAVDLGTACTFDLVVEEADGPRFAGGAISPGLQTMAEALAQRTACLPLISANALRTSPAVGALGQNTQQAMLAGLLHGWRGMALGVLAEMRRHLPQEPSIVLTGGDADLLICDANFDFTIDKLLTLKGILSIYKSHNVFFSGSEKK